MNAIEVRKLSKVYSVSHQLGHNTHPTLKDDIKSLAKKPLAMVGAYHGVEREKFWALKNLNLEIKPGEVVGVMGRNGSGKSTLFKILSQITSPTSGEAVIRGRVGSLLEVGTGFHPELTGRENVFFNGSVLGMKRKEIQKKFDEIVAFSEVEKFLDTPVKYYSSGMKVRLAFSVAAHIDPEILLIDEVLAVGDVKFKQKSIEKMKQVAEGGTTILFVSHIVSQIEKICSRGVVLDGGVSKFDGDLEKAIDKYLELNAVAAEDARDEESRDVSTGRYQISDFKASIETKSGFPELSLVVKISNLENQNEEVDLDMIIHDDLGRSLASASNRALGKSIKMTADVKEVDVRININRVNLLPGRYNVRLIIRPTGDSKATYTLVDKAGWFKQPEYSLGIANYRQRPGSPPVVFKYDYEIG